MKRLIAKFQDLRMFLFPRYALIVVGILVFLSLTSKTGIRYLFDINKNINQVKNEAAEIQKKNDELRATINDFKNNPNMIELYARTKLGLVKKDEIIYEIK